MRNTQISHLQKKKKIITSPAGVEKEHSASKRDIYSHAVITFSTKFIAKILKLVGPVLFRFWQLTLSAAILLCCFLFGQRKKSTTETTGPVISTRSQYLHYATNCIITMTPSGTSRVTVHRNVQVFMVQMICESASYRIRRCWGQITLSPIQLGNITIMITGNNLDNSQHTNKLDMLLWKTNKHTTMSIKKQSFF